MKHPAIRHLLKHCNPEVRVLLIESDIELARESSADVLCMGKGFAGIDHFRDWAVIFELVFYNGAWIVMHVIEC